VKLLIGELADLTTEKRRKKKLLRNNEYYDTQEMYDSLYELSGNDYKFSKLMQYITDDRNILLAYRNIKRNKGSTTKGTDEENIIDIAEKNPQQYLNMIKAQLKNYHPKSVRRVEIPKPNGKTRPLGIPCITDRLVQQCIKQVLEPICEAKFHKRSYGFRPNRSTKHAIARSMYLINMNYLHYVVDIDIKSFFDNVNHGKLLKQIWALGIQDKQLITIISKILKSEIQDIGKPTKGTPQGGILSPLLSNVVLNELDWWISSQWETHITKHQYKNDITKNRALKKSTLKEIYLVRYADDFKIFCRDYKSAQKIYNAVKLWLKERLHLDISTDKSKITNLRKNYTEFLGIKLKAEIKRNKYVCQSEMTKKAIEKCTTNIKKQISKIQKSPTPIEINKLNSIILGIHNYYKMATRININMTKVKFLVRKTLYNRLKLLCSSKGYKSETYKRLYGKYHFKTYSIRGITIFPIAGVTTSPPMSIKQKICNYTKEGRLLIHDNIETNHIILYMINNPIRNQTTEYNDNRISLYIGQKGKCAVTGMPLEIGSMECHHKKPKNLGGTDGYKNLIWLNGTIYKLIHATLQETIQKYLSLIKLDIKGSNLLNNLRKQVGNLTI
jgi:RNA-directed DNA polymerase